MCGQGDQNPSHGFTFSYVLSGSRSFALNPRLIQTDPLSFELGSLWGQGFL